MIKILQGNEVRNLDSTHILNTGISSLSLMENAAQGFVNWWESKSFSKSLRVAVFCGAGNNGGDGLAIARLLNQLGFNPEVFFCFDLGAKLSPDAQANLESLPSSVAQKHWKGFDGAKFDCLIDAFLGVGLKGDLRPDAIEIIQVINSFSKSIYSIDVPSGLPSEGMASKNCVKAEVTITFAFPKLSLLLPENASISGELIVVDIGIGDEEYEAFDSQFYYLQEKDIPEYHRKFSRFSHKGDFGKILLVAGSKGTMGAAILSSKSALRTGSGLVTCYVPIEERSIIQSAVPEAMVYTDQELRMEKFDAIGVGPGMGVDQHGLLKKILEGYKAPLVLDADALTILSRDKDLIPLIPKGSILTPHLGEFERLFGKISDPLLRLKAAREFCINFQLNLLIKGANSVICLADGRQIFNSSGTNYMATGGSGDVLTGMLTSFLGQGYSPEQALVCGVFQHGLAGEIAGSKKFRSTIASDILEAIPMTFQKLSIL
ncbi:bifunctional ADP-dependent NAD(P)H-hydrate dehydratase/NAD(P)H-hydrate epimerase [Algoriphagus mannitolivorans]|uniref:bifunctional ADP-dependent NAD(P)H-hydrate dehydratase/NAD(P)H-hydrate epimerase n=1 Tax=Algoriphagus mannitolivorans TaxID=226504 RepID=UPI000427A0B3|nr:bifunctional ADP-dependent NAD(P)H-hydrate dehydratase/NAD(P)H-hydrate epimerase [Algoriphagus mannitolivorans]